MEVKVDGLPSGASPVSQLSGPACPVDTPVRIWVEVRMSNGLRLSQKNLSYRDLVRVMENLEGLC